MELDDVLSEEPRQEPPVEKVVETEGRHVFQEKERAAQEAGRQRGPDGKFVAEEKPEVKPEVKAEVKPEPQEMTAKERALLAKAQDEINKRQRLEHELAQLKASQQPAEPQKSFYEDPDGVLKQVETRIGEMGQQFQQQFIQQRIAAAELVARGRHADFDECVPIFGELLKTTPGLYQQWIQSQDPAEFAYMAGKNTKMIREAGSLDAIRQQVEKELRAKLEKEFKEREAALQKTREAIPDSLSTARSASPPRVSWAGPSSLDSILK